MIIDAATTCGLMCSSYVSDSQSTLDPVAQVVSRARDGSPLDAVAATRYMYSSYANRRSEQRSRRASAEEPPRKHGLVLLDGHAVGQGRDPLVEVGLGHAVLHHGFSFLVADVQHGAEVGEQMTRAVEEADVAKPGSFQPI